MRGSYLEIQEHFYTFHMQAKTSFIYIYIPGLSKRGSSTVNVYGKPYFLCSSRANAAYTIYAVQYSCCQHSHIGMKDDNICHAFAAKAADQCDWRVLSASHAFIYLASCCPLLSKHSLRRLGR